MKSHKRAIIYAKRNLDKVVIFIILLITIGTLVSGAISVNRAFGQTEENLRNQMPAIFAFNPHASRYLSRYGMEREDFLVILNEELPAIGALPYVASYVVSRERWEYSTDIRRYIICYENHNPNFILHNTPGLSFIYFHLRSFSNPEIIHFETGQMEIIAGRTFLSEEFLPQREGMPYPVIISRHLAQVNNLWVGDNFYLSVVLSDLEIPIDTEIPNRLERNYEWIDHNSFQIIGIWDYLDEQTEFLHNNDIHVNRSRERFLNTLLVPEFVIQNLDQFHDELWEWNYATGRVDTVFAYFLLNDPRDAEAFVAAVRGILHPEFYLNNHDGRFSSISHSLAALLAITDFVMWGAILANIIILVLLLMLFLYDRRHEIGIYLSLGERKQKIVMQFITEILIVAFIGTTIALFVGNIISNHLSQELLRNEITAFHENFDWRDLSQSNPITDVEILFGFNEISYYDLLVATDTGFDLGTTVIFYAVSLGIVLLATALPVLYIVKMNPKKILL